MTAPPDYVNDARFSQTFELPADLANGRSKPFKVMYADYGYRNIAHPEEENVFLFYGSMLGSRLVHVAKDEIARKQKIRIINPDRPGIGGTDAAEAGQKLSIWREAMSALLQYLGIRHVSLGCHSGGTIYALDMLLHHPEILHPEKPYLAIGGPWILPSHTSSTMLSIVQSLPASAISQFDKIAKVVNQHISPVLGICLGLSQGLVAKVTPASLIHEDEGMNREGAKMEAQIWPKLLEHIYANGVKGVSSEAVLLMQKADGNAGWSDWGDFDVLIPRLVERLRAVGSRLRIDCFYAENDFMIGDGGSKGPRWFDQCWGVESYGDVIEYHSVTIKEADHDGIWHLRWGVMQTTFERILDRPVEQPLSTTISV